MPLILGSSSPRRRALLGATGLSFTVARPDIDETPLPDEPAEQYVARLSREKALAVNNGSNDSTPGNLILTADTTVVLDGQIIGKPADADEAIAMLRSLRGRAHLVHTGLSLRDSSTGLIQTAIITTRVFMRDYTDGEIVAYVASREPFDKAGGYAVQDPNFRPVEHMEGCYTNVMGLPLCAVHAILSACGVAMPAPPACSPDYLPCQTERFRDV